MDRIVEPVVFCIGESIVGNPTQFVMERLAAEANLDWRFITAEVSARNLEAAVTGIMAMNLDGIAFLQAVKNDPLIPMDSIGESVLTSNLVTAARRDEISWLAENLDGVALSTLLRDHVKIEVGLAIDDVEENVENNVEENVEHNAVGNILIYGSPAIANLLRLAIPKISSRIVIATTGEPTALAASSAMPPISSKPNGLVDGASSTVSTATQIRSFPRSALAEAALNVSALISVGPLSQLDVSLLRRCNVAVDALAIDLSDSEQTLEKNRESLSEFHWLGRSEFEVARLAASFQFWTGHSAEPALIHEYLDEYSQW